MTLSSSQTGTPTQSESTERPPSGGLFVSGFRINLRGEHQAYGSSVAACLNRSSVAVGRADGNNAPPAYRAIRGAASPSGPPAWHGHCYMPRRLSFRTRLRQGAARTMHFGPGGDQMDRPNWWIIGAVGLVTFYVAVRWCCGASCRPIPDRRRGNEWRPAVGGAAESIQPRLQRTAPFVGIARIAYQRLALGQRAAP